MVIQCSRFYVTQSFNIIYIGFVSALECQDIVLEA